MQIRTLGALALPGSKIDNHKQLLLLLAYLAHHGETPRDHVAWVFWPQASDARNSLSSALSRLRRLVPGVIVATRKSVSTTATTDALQLLEARQPAPDLVALYRGVFLPSVDISNEQLELAEWIAEMRHRVTERAVILIGQFPDGSAERQRLSTQLAADADNSILAATDRQRIVDVLRSEARTAKRFFGRESMLNELADTIRPGSLTCVFGLRGAGKSALLDEFVHRAHQLSPTATVHKMNLDSEADPEAIGNAIAKIGERAWHKSAQPRKAVIVLDDVAATAEVVEALRTVSDSGVAVVFATLAKPTTIENSVFVPGLDDADAIQLFAERVNGHDVANLGVQATLIERICKQVANNPLGIELLAAWSDVVPLEQLARVDERPWLLSDTPPFSKSTIVGIVEGPIQILDDRNRSLLASLGVLRGCFDTATALVVAGAGPDDLETLSSCALLERSSKGFFAVHPLVSGALRLHSDERRDAVERLDAYLGSLLAGISTSASDESVERELTLNRLQVHAKDVDLAWQRAIERRDWEWVDQVVNKYTVLAGMSKSGLKRMHAVEKSLQAMEKHGAPASVRQRANRDYAVVASQIQLPTESIRAAITRALAIGPDVDGDAYLGAQRVLARELADEGQRGSAIAVLAQGLREVQTPTPTNNYSLARLDLAFLLTDDGKANAAIELLEPAIAGFVSANDQRLLAQHLYCLARVQIGVNRTEALDTIREAEAVIENTDFYFRQVLAVLRAYAYYADSAYARALAHFKKAERLAPDTAGEAILGKAKCRIRLGRFREARAPLRTGLRAALQAGSLPDVLFTAIAVSDVALIQNQENDTARALLKYAWDHPGLPTAEYLAPEHDPNLFIPTQAIERTLRLDEICELTLTVYQSIAGLTPHAHHVRNS